tara:strand:+ start:18047 stop:18502 length:456 start_codon:yes stop_codon:yes gene_type:complete
LPVVLSSKGNPIQVDERDLDRVLQHSWSEFPGNGKTYLHATIGGKQILLHRFILKPEKEEIVDHKNRDTFDNRRKNLRIATLEQNAHNRVVNHHSTTGLKGVSPSGDRWRARIRMNGSRIHLGCFETKEQAFEAYRAASIKYHGEFSSVTS